MKAKSQLNLDELFTIVTKRVLRERKAKELSEIRRQKQQVSKMQRERRRIELLLVNATKAVRTAISESERTSQALWNMLICNETVEILKQFDCVKEGVLIKNISDEWIAFEIDPGTSGLFLFRVAISNKLMSVTERHPLKAKLPNWISVVVVRKKENSVCGIKYVPVDLPSEATLKSISKLTFTAGVVSTIAEASA